MSKSTATTSTIQISEERETLMLAMELGETGWLLGFASAYGQKPLRRKIASRDRKALLREIEWAKAKLGLEAESRVVSCYEAGRDGFWLHRFLVAQDVESLIVDSASIEVNRKKRRAKTDRIDLVALLDLLARHLAGSRRTACSAPLDTSHNLTTGSRMSKPTATVLPSRDSAPEAMNKPWP